MTFELGLHPGTTWHKCDFQCHTPRDRAWSGSPDLPGGTEEAERARNEWAEHFVVAADTAKLRAATGWAPRIALDQTLADILADWRQQAG